MNDEILFLFNCWYVLYLLEDMCDNFFCLYELYVNNFVKRKMVVFGF